MKGKKECSFSFDSKTKETIQDRIKQLFNGRNLRQVAREWDLPYSTLNNYFEKGAMPGLNVVMNICQKENIPLDWLVFGGASNSTPDSKVSKKDDKTKHAWDMIYDSLTENEVSELLRTIHRKGITTIIENHKQEEVDDIESAIDSLDIRFTLKQAIKEALKGDEKLDQEILRRIENRKNSLEAGQQSLDQPKVEYKNIG